MLEYRWEGIVWTRKTAEVTHVGGIESCSRVDESVSRYTAELVALAISVQSANLQSIALQYVHGRRTYVHTYNTHITQYQTMAILRRMAIVW